LRARREGGWSHPPEPRSTRAPRRRSWLARAGATLALGAALVTVLWVRDAGPGSSLAAASAAAPSAAALPPLPATKHVPAAAAPTHTAAAANASASSESPRPLRDEQLLELFALEQHTTLAECPDRRPTAPPLPAPRARQKSQTQLKAARVELARGNVNAAQLWLCSATALYPGNIAAWQALAELALQRGDGAQAQRTLSRALKRKADDPTLLAALGDAEALLGNLQQSRTLWTRSAPAGQLEAEPGQRLAARFDVFGARELSAGNFGTALAHYRRAVVLSAGASAPSAGMAKSLRGLNQPKAAAPWELRAAELRR
jgi:tetratricopeptide (TPR) repeat protein